MLFQQILNGLTIGSVYALVALGYTLAYGILGLINFSHGEIYMIGAFIAFTCISILGLNIWISLIIAILLCGLIGILIEIVAFRSIRHGARSSQLISAIGVSVLLQNTAMLTWGSGTKPFPQVVPTQINKINDLVLSNLQIYILITAVALMVILYFLLYKSRIGIAMRATSQDSDTTSLMGINVNRVISITFAVGSILGAAAGILMGIYYNSIVFNMGYTVGLKAFVAAILGGIGNIPGTMLGGVILGLVESLAAGFISSQYKDALAFLIMIIVLLVKPTGIFGKKEVEKV
ncbi:branched-chain amino acid ABC transporter permease [Petroclostridium sp. X23]|uniref:branched-chain amino acid ABC transporter permease n=1 Tax=Petroclostridium sp. X23 TaxID=3045146 RepID=UPI0024AD2217|nr:branched-chain amino acid ABC transporter permease [Petroclostridium sp. X23]WHH57924.1 branched-chain amino acid ABC transporter permease [Petroclostridium sp. X23]